MGSLDVFVCWAHRDSGWSPKQEHAWKAEVQRFLDLLRAADVRVTVDIDREHNPPDWTRWGPAQVRTCDVVLALCSPSWRRSFEETDYAGAGTGVTAEIDELLGIFGRDPRALREKLILAVLPSRLEQDTVPGRLSGYPRRELATLSATAVAPLVRLINQPAAERAAPPPGTRDGRSARPRRSARARAWIALGAGAAVAVAAVLGWQLSQRRVSQPVSSGDLRASVPPDWTPTVPQWVAGDTGLPAAVGFAPPGRPGAGVAMSVSPATGPTLLPRALVAQLDRDQLTPTAVTVGGMAGYRYPRLRPGRQGERVLDVFVVPASVGVLTVACYSRLADADAFAPQCARVANTLTLKRGQPLVRSSLAAYSSTLAATLAHLNASSGAGRRRLQRADTAAGRASAAADLTKTFARAAHVLSTADVSPLDAGVNDRLVAALDRTSRAYRRLQEAADPLRRATFNLAGHTVRTAEAELRATQRGLHALGYRVE